MSKRNKTTDKERIAFMKTCLITEGVSWTKLYDALRTFHNRFPHYSKNVVISYFMDAMENMKTKAYGEFRKRKH